MAQLRLFPNSPGWAGQCGWRGLGGCQLGLARALPQEPPVRWMWEGGALGGIQVSSLQEETKSPLSGLSWVRGSGLASDLPLLSLASWGFLAWGQLSGLTIAVPPSWSLQLGSSAWGLARPLPLPLSPRQGASCQPPSTQRPHLTPYLSMDLGGCWA